MRDGQGSSIAKDLAVSDYRKRVRLPIPGNQEAFQNFYIIRLSFSPLFFWLPCKSNKLHCNNLFSLLVWGLAARNQWAPSPRFVWGFSL